MSNPKYLPDGFKIVEDPEEANLLLGAGLLWFICRNDSPAVTSQQDWTDASTKLDMYLCCKNIYTQDNPYIIPCVRVE